MILIIHYTVTREGPSVFIKVFKSFISHDLIKNTIKFDGLDVLLMFLLGLSSPGMLKNCSSHPSMSELGAQ